MSIFTFEDNECEHESTLGNLIELASIFGPIIAFIVYLAINR